MQINYDKLNQKEKRKKKERKEEHFPTETSIFLKLKPETLGEKKNERPISVTDLDATFFTQF